MAQDQQGILRFIRGLFKDTSPIDQPMGTYRYAKNAVINDTSGSVSNEPGNKIVDSLPAGSIVIGTIPITDNRIVLCIKHGTQSEVGIYGSETYQTVLRLPLSTSTDTDLNFSPEHPISGTFKEQADGDLIVYWTDFYNPPRTLNITRQLQGSFQQLYGKNVNSSPDTKLVNFLNLFPHAGPVPHVELQDVYSGGGCRTGVYFLALAYADADFTETNYVTVANPVPIVDDAEGISPIESYDGAPPNTLTGKSITWNVSNINTDMKYLVPQVIQRIGGVDTAVQIGRVEINGRSNFTVTYSGENREEIQSSPDIVLVDNAEYTKVKTMEQLDAKLYLGNLEAETDIGYQPYANFIKSSPCTHVFDPFDPFELTNTFLSENISISKNNDRKKGYRDPKNIFELKGYQRDEVYAFYISFILKSGRMSYAYHIPGRQALENVDRNLMNELIGDESPNSSPPIINEGEPFYGNGNGTVGEWDVIDLTGQSDPQGYLYQWYDFSHLTTYDSRGMNFWKNLHEFYPNTDDFVARNAQNPTVIQEDLREQNVRHHRFPGNKNAEYTTVKYDPNSNAESTFGNLRVKPKLVVRWFWFGALQRDAGFNIQGKYMQEDFSGARSFQAQVTIAGRSMGGYHGQNIPNDIERSLASKNTSGLTYENNCVDFPIGSDKYTKLDAATACHPEANTTFHNVLFNTGGSGVPSTGLLCLGGCEPARRGGLNRELLNICPNTSNDVEIEYKYSTDPMPPGTRFFIAYDRKAGTGEDVCNKEPHCSGMGVGQVSSDSGQEIFFDDIAWQGRGTGGTDEENDTGRSHPGWAAWVSCEEELEDDPTNVLEHEVQALGICFDDIKIPKSIADKVQGFRIYYAKRTHENRTILGQAPIHPMGVRGDMDISGCDGGGLNRGLIDYYLPGGQPVITNDLPSWPVYGVTFNDFYLLRNRPTLSQATHLRFQYTLCFANFKGHVEYYSDRESAFDTDLNTTPEIYSCKKPSVITSFHISGDHYRTKGNPTRLNWILEGRAKKYLNGGTIYDGTIENFGKKIYTIGGHSTIALKLKRILPYLASANIDGENWRELRGDGAGVSYVGYTTNSYDPESPGTGLQLHMANLHAFKTDVYNRTDDQELVWTGFEVTGSDVDRFVVDDNGTPIASSPNFGTGKIFGGDTYICRYGYRMTHREEVNSDKRYPNTGSIDRKSVVMTIVESTENINFRHIDKEGEPYFPGTSLKETLKVEADVDLSYSPDPDTGKLRYNPDYSSVNDVKVVSPLPWVFEQEERFPVRVIRSSQATSSMLLDNYREYIATESRDLNNRYGELWKITAMSNILLFHMEDALYQTKGKQQMQVSQGGQAYVGQGDIFEQLPDLVRHTDSGYIGTRSQFAAVSTPEGYFFVDNIDRKIFLLGDGVEDLSGQKYGMSNWLADNLPYELEAYGFHGKIDSFITGMGFHAVWDEYFGRVILTKRDLKPTEKFKELWKGSFNSIGAAYGTASSGIVYVNGTYYQLGTVIPGPILQLGGTELELDVSTQIDGLPLFERTGWTISFAFSDLVQGQKGFWESFHDYVPYMYSYAKTDVHSFTDGSYDIWRHNDYDNMGSFYGTVYPFEIEIISNMVSQIDKVYSSFNFLAEVKDRVGGQFLINDHHAGFDQYMTFGNNSSSGLRNIEYLVNIRKNGSEWSVNQFRDLSIDVTDTSPYLTGPYLGSNYILPGQNVVGGQNQGTVTAIPQSIFNVNGMNETVNPLYTDTNKPWYKQSKFIGKYMGIRLRSDNSANKLINLYSVLADFRPYRR
jgi:hypothetical protein